MDSLAGRLVEDPESLAHRSLASISSRLSRSTHTVAAFGGIDILVNNAGIEIGKPLLETNEDEFDHLIAVNLKGRWLCAVAVVPEMRRRGRGSIVNTSSVLVLASMRDCSVYAASKAGIIGPTRSMALEWTPLGIRVNCVLPGSTETEMMYFGLDPAAIPSRRRAEEEAIPIGRVAAPEGIAQASRAHRGRFARARRTRWCGGAPRW